ncbi:uncharacterized protein LOC113857424 [Abrus precatorius]|uniref:Uncharacterized protein LOC113857424 n=1 Tax=Abrus precatorius TaxID=3816 RepID=A0A8B8KMM9_ABRPR|nr:uncharacterized protein LOC113857424 [Abrus precatorius]
MLPRLAPQVRPPINPAADQLSVYYVHPRENPCQALVSLLLLSKNYHAWAHLITRALISKNKFKFVNENLPKPSDDFDPSRVDDNLCNFSDLVHLSKSFIKLQQEILNFKQGTYTVTDYFTQLSTLWEEVNSFHPFPNFSCSVRCVCVTSTCEKLYRSEDYVMKFLAGLNDELDVVKTQILMIDPFPTLDRVFSLVLQQERRISPNIMDDSHAFVNASDSRNKNYGNSKEKNYRYCDHCKRPSHTKDFCYKLHGPSSDLLRKYFRSLNNIVGESSAVNDDDQTSVKAGSEASFSLSAEEYKVVISLLQQANLTGNVPQSQVAALTTRDIDPIHNSGNTFVCTFQSNNASTWIIDSGAIDHIYFDKSLFFIFRSLSFPISVKLPNGSYAIATHSGNVPITSYLTLLDVLFLLEFSVNLISAPKLAKHQYCAIILLSDICIMQDLKRLKKIGSVDLVCGLYTIHSSPSIIHSQPSINNTVSDCSSLKFIVSELPHEISPPAPTDSTSPPVVSEAMALKLAALEGNGTWSLVTLPTDVKPIGCKWVYKIKRKLEGIIERYKDLGILKYFLGLEVAHTISAILVSQKKYYLDLLKDTALTNCKPATTPLDPALKLYQDKVELFLDVSSYRRLVGHLLYLNFARLDITFATQQVSQFMATPTMTHYRAALRIARYLKQAPNWGRCLDTRRSINNYYFFLGNSLVSWHSKKQTIVARSSTEAEYRALSFTVCELQWLDYLFRDLHIQYHKPLVLFYDNQSAIYITQNPVFHERTKHLEIDCHLVREKLLARLFRLLLVSTHNQIAEFFPSLSLQLCFIPFYLS